MTMAELEALDLIARLRIQPESYRDEHFSRYVAVLINAAPEAANELERLAEESQRRRDLAVEEHEKRHAAEDEYEAERVRADRLAKALRLIAAVDAPGRMRCMQIAYEALHPKAS